MKNKTLTRDALWREYVQLLEKELDSMAGMVYAHGWRGSLPDRVARGKELRKLLGIEKSTDER